MTAGRHRRGAAGGWRRHSAQDTVAAGQRLIEWVHTFTGVLHLLTPEAVWAGTPGGGGYITLCGLDLTPGPMTEPGQSRCQRCYATTPDPRRHPR